MFRVRAGCGSLLYSELLYEPEMIAVLGTEARFESALRGRIVKCAKLDSGLSW